MKVFEASPGRSSRIRHRNALTERAWKDAVWGLGKVFNGNSKSLSIECCLETKIWLCQQGFTRSPLLGASICAVPLSLPIPVKNYFKNRLSREINVFSRTSAYFCGEKKNGDERGKLANKFIPCSITVAPASVPSLTTEESWFRVNINNMYKSGFKILLYFVATHEVLFAVVALFGCLNFARNGAV